MDPETAQRIERLEYQVAMLYRRLGLSIDEPTFLPPPPNFPPPSAGSTPPPYAAGPQDSVPGPPIGPRLPQAFYDAVAAGKKIQAIKIYREQTNVGLKTAKDYVDSLDPNHYRRR